MHEFGGAAARKVAEGGLRLYAAVMQRFVPRDDSVPWRRDDRPDSDPDQDAGPPVSLRQRISRSHEKESSDELEQLRSERDEYLDLARRCQADLENLRRRSVRELAQTEQRALARLVLELAPVLDHFELALAGAGDEQPTADVDATSIVRGVMMIYSELTRVIERLGVQTIEPAGDVFDPVLHHAVMARKADDANAGRVVQVVSQGYAVGDHVVRPARVVVAE